MIRLAVPGDIETPTGGYVYARKALAAARGAMTPLALPAGFPAPSEAELAAAARALAAAEGPLLVDGLAYGVLPPALIRALPRRPVALCHHPLGWEAGLTEAESARLVAAERAALAEAAHVIVTSPATRAALVESFGLAPGAVTVAPPGLDRPAPVDRTGHAGPPVILTVASYTPRKGHDALAAALSRLGDRDWRAVWAGAAGRAPDYEAKLRAAIAASGLSDRIEMKGPMAPDELAALYAAADIFCLPSRYEGYGMVFAEAMAAGLPVVGCAAAAVAELVPPAAGVLTPPGDAAALAAALDALLGDAPRRAAMGAAGRARAAAIPGWDETWAIIADAMARWG